MARRDQVVRHLEIDALRLEIQRPTLIYVRSHLLVHGRSATGSACPCCSNTHAVVIDDRPDLELLIDTEAGTRDLRHHVADRALFDELAAAADLAVDLPLRCSEIGAEIVLSDRRITVGQGASRSAKTQHGVVWGARRWMLCGGPEVEALFCGPELRHAHLLKRKWCLGEGESPPVMDPRLVLSFPTRLREEDQAIRMVDGTIIHIMHLKGDGTNVAGLSPAWINGTELAKVHDAKNWAQLRTRVVSSGGHIYLDAVPEPKHWFKQAIIDPAAKEEDEAQRAEGEPEPKREWLVLQMSADDNPWNPPGEGAAAIRDLEHLDPRLAARYGAGEWVGDCNKTFGEYFDPRRHTFEYEGWDVEYLGLVDVTRAASLAHFPRPVDWLAACDINAMPHTALAGKIAVPPGVTKDIHPTRYGSISREHWIYVFFAYEQRWGIDSEQAALNLAEVHGGKFKGCGVIIDATSAYKGHNAGGGANRSKNIVPAQAYKAAGFQVRAPDRTSNGKPGNPRRHDSAIVVRRLLRDERGRILINAQRCSKLIGALRDQDSEADGITPARATGTWTDAHIVSGTDVTRYFTWPFARLDKPDAPGTREIRDYA
jgi:hypothetical protein